MISKPLFKQSFKANFSRWLIVTIASCFIVAVVVMILGHLDVNKIRKSLEDLFQDSDKEAEIQYDSVEGYEAAYEIYDKSISKYNELSAILDKVVAGTATDDDIKDFSQEFKDAVNKINSAKSEIASSKQKLSNGEAELASSKATYNSKKTEYNAQLKDLQSKKTQIEQGIAKCESGLKEINAGIAKYEAGIADAQTKLNQVNAGMEKALSQAQNDAQKTAIKSSTEYKTLETQKTQLEAGIAKSKTEEESLKNTKKTTEATEADLKSKLKQVNDGISKINTGLSDGASKISSAESQIASSKQKISLGGSELSASIQKLKDETIAALPEQIGNGVRDEAINQGKSQEDAEKAKSMALDAVSKVTSGERTDADSIKKYAKEYVSSNVYQEAKDKGHSEDEASLAKTVAENAIDTYNNKIANGKTVEEAKADISRSLIDQLPEEVSSAIEEIKDLNVYALVVGNILFRIAGLLLPMIFVIMTANSLIAGQVDSGSMAYVLSTPTRRIKIAFTQAVYLMTSVISMYGCIAITSAVCTKMVEGSDFTITIEQMLKFCVGACCVILAVSGICFLASCLFNREKNSLSVGGGITMFFLVCSILGLFGEKVIPSAIRIDAMNYFNYASIISLFDVNSIIDGTTAWIPQLLILLLIGFVTYAIGTVYFTKKDLPL